MGPSSHEFNRKSDFSDYCPLADQYGKSDLQLEEVGACRVKSDASNIIGPVFYLPSSVSLTTYTIIFMIILFKFLC